jgi:hypothetical protein
MTGMAEKLSEDFLSNQLDELYGVLNRTLNDESVDYENVIRLMMHYQTFVTKVVEDLMTEAKGYKQPKELRSKVQSIYVHEQLDAIEKAKMNFWRKTKEEMRDAA